jgi:hypothetical protein
VRAAGGGASAARIRREPLELGFCEPGREAEGESAGPGSRGAKPGCVSLGRLGCFLPVCSVGPTGSQFRAEPASAPSAGSLAIVPVCWAHLSRMPVCPAVGQQPVINRPIWTTPTP